MFGKRHRIWEVKSSGYRRVCRQSRSPNDFKHTNPNSVKVLGYVQEAQKSGIPFEADEGTIDTPHVRALLREAANAGIVLLKNDDHVLPLKTDAMKGKKIAIIGPNAKASAYSGGGSANLSPTYTITPFEALSKAEKELDMEVAYSIGADGSRWLPLLTPYIFFPGGQKGDAPAVVCDFFTEK